MKLSLKINIVMSTILAVICVGVGLDGFTSLSGIADADRHADAVGYAWFWMFLGLVCALFGVVGWWLLRTQKED